MKVPCTERDILLVDLDYAVHCSQKLAPKCTRDTTNPRNNLTFHRGSEPANQDQQVHSRDQIQPIGSPEKGHVTRTSQSG